MLNHAYKNIMKIIHPNSVLSLKIGTKSVDDQVATSVWGFFSIYVISFVILLLIVVLVFYKNINLILMEALDSL